MTCAYVPTAPVSPSLQGSGRGLDAVTTLDPLGVAWADERTENRVAAQPRPIGRAARIALESEDAVTCTVTANGEFFVQTQEAQGQKRRIAGHGSVTLPTGIAADSFRIQRQVFDGSRTLEAVVTWGSPGNPAARLRIMSPSVAASAFDWCKVRACAGLPLDEQTHFIHPRIARRVIATMTLCCCCPVGAGTGVWVRAGVPNQKRGCGPGRVDHGARMACRLTSRLPFSVIPGCMEGHRRHDMLLLLRRTWRLLGTGLAEVSHPIALP